MVDGSFAYSLVHGQESVLFAWNHLLGKLTEVTGQIVSPRLKVSIPS